MSRPPLEQLREVLGTLDELVGLGRERYDTDPLIRWSIQRLWIFAERNVLAHYLPDDVNDERVWFDTAGDISGLRQQVDEAAEGTGPPAR